MMSDFDFNRFRVFIYETCGINLTPVKKTMLTARLRKRLHSLQMDSFAQYFKHVSHPSNQNGELVHMVDAVSTNKTDFFRESAHFDFLKNEALPRLIESGEWGPGRKLNLWSAGCSSGEEPYTLAMVIAGYIGNGNPLDFSITASDISTHVLDIAAKGIYPESVLNPVPETLKRKYMMRGTGSRKGFCRFTPEIRSKVQFQRINLIEPGNFPFKTPMDIIFCRNVIIYFDRVTQTKLFDKFYRCLAPEGYLFIGHSETLHGISDSFYSVAGSTYMKTC
ncbi:MAG: protein-glutamate O-methyltransferase [Proteobacteria bacterium]|nr:protein-glutamate O-methyltransferase [Pseudomonadota bacterium]